MTTTYIITEKQTTRFSKIREKEVSNTSETSEFTHIELKALRESRKMPRWKVAREIGVSESTLERWESGEKKPEPDDVGNLERVLKAPGTWHMWMLSNYDSYRERYIEVPRGDSLAEMILRMKCETLDVASYAAEIERDSLDGKFDAPETTDKLDKEIAEAMAAMQQVRDKIHAKK